jgi:hypothetical protein
MRRSSVLGRWLGKGTWVAAAVLLVGPMAACSGSNPTCPDLGGTWTIAEHCTSSFVGQTVDVQAEGNCVFNTSGAFPNFSITVAQGQIATVAGTIGGTTIACTGPADESILNLTCAPPPSCNVTLTR